MICTFFIKDLKIFNISALYLCIPGIPIVGPGSAGKLHSRYPFFWK